MKNKIKKINKAVKTMVLAFFVLSLMLIIFGDFENITSAAGENDLTYESIEGTYKGYEQGGSNAEWKWIFKDNTIHSIGPNEEYFGTYTFDTSVTPHLLNYTITSCNIYGNIDIYKGQTSLGIFEVHDGVFYGSANEPGASYRPTSYSEGRYYVLTKVDSQTQEDGGEIIGVIAPVVAVGAVTTGALVAFFRRTN